MFSPELLTDATDLLATFRKHGFKIATAESCTGGLIAALLTEIAGSSDVVDRGFVTYSNEAKIELIGVSPTVISQHGAVSEETARAMAMGAVAHSRADVSVAVTGVAGPGGGSPAKPVGLVHIAAARKGGAVIHRECLFGDLGRSGIRLATVGVALSMLREAAVIS